MTWTLIHNDGQRWDLSPGSHRLGREADNSIVLNDAGVSRWHAELTVSDLAAHLKDLGSTNGSYVNGRRVSTAKLTGGETLGFGQTCQVRLQRTGSPERGPVKRPTADLRQMPRQMQELAGRVRPRPVPVAAGGNATKWISGIIIVFIVLGAAVKLADKNTKLQQFLGAVGSGNSTVRSNAQAQAEAQEQRRREIENLRHQAAALANDTEFDQRLVRVLEVGGYAVDAAGKASYGLTQAAIAIQNIQNSALGQVALEKLGLSDVGGKVQALGRDVGGLRDAAASIQQTANTLRVGLHAYRGTGNDEALRALRAPALAAARQARELAQSVGSQRSKMDEALQLLDQMAGVAGRIGLSAVADLMQEATGPLRTLRDAMSGIETFFERDQENFRLLERAAEAV